MTRTSLLLCIASALPACAGSEDPPRTDAPATILPGSTHQPPGARPPKVLATVTDGRGGVVEIYEPAEPGELNVGIGASYPNRPPVTGAFVLSHDPIEVFLAVAPLDAPIPSALRDAYPELSASADVTSRKRLRETLHAELATFPSFDVAIPYSHGSCSAAFIAWFDAVYKSAPDESATCSTQGGAEFKNGTRFYYQDDGALPITDDDPCSPYVAECDMFKLTFRDWNWGVENFHGNSWGAQHDRHNMHTGMATCAGAATFKRQWGDTPYSIDLAAGQGWHQYIGRFPSNTGPAVELVHGLWGLKPPKRYARSEVTNNAGTSDRVIWCANLEDQWNMTDQSTCHNWCDIYGNGCANDCFDDD